MITIPKNFFFDSCVSEFIPSPIPIKTGFWEGVLKNDLQFVYRKNLNFFKIYVIIYIERKKIIKFKKYLKFERRIIYE